MSTKQFDDMQKLILRAVFILLGFFASYVFYEKMEQIGYVYASTLRLEVKILELEKAVESLKQIR
jgi:hypothetical protein